jgi:hypothetical protein
MADYNVGYKKPPKSGRFTKGRSGNPAGRPKGAGNRLQPQMLQMRDMLLDEAYRNVTIQDKSGPLTLPVAQAAMRSLALKAAQGTMSVRRNCFCKACIMRKAKRSMNRPGFSSQLLHSRSELMPPLPIARNTAYLLRTRFPIPTM